jgi:hypothetical protein
MRAHAAAGGDGGARKIEARMRIAMTVGERISRAAGSIAGPAAAREITGEVSSGRRPWPLAGNRSPAGTPRAAGRVRRSRGDSARQAVRLRTAFGVQDRLVHAVQGVAEGTQAQGGGRSDQCCHDGVFELGPHRARREESLPGSSSSSLSQDRWVIIIEIKIKCQIISAYLFSTIP